MQSVIADGRTHRPLPGPCGAASSERSAVSGRDEPHTSRCRGRDPVRRSEHTARRRVARGAGIPAAGLERASIGDPAAGRRSTRNRTQADPSPTGARAAERVAGRTGCTDPTRAAAVAVFQRVVRSQATPFAANGYCRLSGFGQDGSCAHLPQEPYDADRIVTKFPAVRIRVCPLRRCECHLSGIRSAIHRIGFFLDKLHALRQDK